MYSVLALFLIPWGGGIPAGVLRAQKLALPWHTTSVLYLISDIILALFFEPALRFFIRWCKTRPAAYRFAIAFRASLLRSAGYFGGSSVLALVIFSFGADPMSGRTVAAAVGHGPISGWAIAITDDMLYFWVVMSATLGLNSFLGSPNTTMWIILIGMLLLPPLISKAKNALLRRFKHV
jgi:hypothetical protein